MRNICVDFDFKMALILDQDSLKVLASETWA